MLGTLKTSVTHSLLRHRSEHLNKRSKTSTKLKLSETLMRIYLKLTDCRLGRFARQKFHTDDVKSVRNPVRSPDWSREQLHYFSYCLRMTDKRQKATKVKC